VEHIEKIVETYRKGKTIDKYSYVAGIDEIKENDFNLNIPRYVDTFKEEEPVDLKAVSDELKAMEKAMKEADKEIGKFCKC
jgi:type I restriction enzyme M protein